MAVESDWVLVGCTGETEAMQKVTAYCRKKDNDSSSGCSAVFNGGAKNTYVVPGFGSVICGCNNGFLDSIIKLPSGCGGPYARLHSLEVNNSISLAGVHASKKPVSNHVYAVEFDFDFGRM